MSGTPTVTFGVRLRVLGCFEAVIDGTTVNLPTNAQRVLGYLAAVESAQRRETLAGRLWGDSSQARAQASLRDALWRIRAASTGFVHATRDMVQLKADVGVDLADSQCLARQLIDNSDDEHLPAGLGRQLLEQDLLPTWDEDWIVLERERLRQLRLHALEALSRVLTDRGQFAQAIEAALAAIHAEPRRDRSLGLDQGLPRGEKSVRSRSSAGQLPTLTRRRTRTGTISAHRDTRIECNNTGQ